MSQFQNIKLRTAKQEFLKLLNKNEYLHEFYDNFHYKYITFMNRRKINNSFLSRIKRLKQENSFSISNETKLNIIIITIDCLRSSSLSSHGYHRKTTPFMDSLHSNFKATATSSFTYPSVPSILSGLYPHNHGAIIKGKIKMFYNNLKNFRGIQEKVFTLPEVLFALGYSVYFATAIDVAYYPFKDRIMNPILYPNIKCHKLLNHLKSWISMEKPPFFAYCHLADLHAPLNPPKEFKNYFGIVKKLPNIKNWDYRKFDQQNGKDFELYKENRILLYDNTLRYVDHSIENFCNYLEKMGLLDSTLLIITADHGEEFWEYADLEAKYFYDPRSYQGTDHGHNVFNSIIEVPIILSGPKIPKIKSDGVSTADIVPTIFDLLKIKSDLKFDGVNLYNNKESRILLTEAMGFGFEKKALKYGKFKLIYSYDDRIQWVFDLEKDPYEKNPIKDDKITSLFVNKLLDFYTNKEKREIKHIIKSHKYF